MVKMILTVKIILKKYNFAVIIDFTGMVKEVINVKKMQFTALSGRRSVLERPLSGENGRPFLVNTPDIIGY